MRWGFNQHLDHRPKNSRAPPPVRAVESNPAAKATMIAIAKPVGRFLLGVITTGVQRRSRPGWFGVRERRAGHAAAQVCWRAAVMTFNK
jgi:hypothetical protein